MHVRRRDTTHNRSILVHNETDQDSRNSRSRDTPQTSSLCTSHGSFGFCIVRRSHTNNFLCLNRLTNSIGSLCLLVDAPPKLNMFSQSIFGACKVLPPAFPDSSTEYCYFREISVEHRSRSYKTMAGTLLVHRCGLSGRYLPFLRFLHDAILYSCFFDIVFCQQCILFSLSRCTSHFTRKTTFGAAAVGEKVEVGH